MGISNLERMLNEEGDDKGVIAIMDHRYGDKKEVWNPRIQDEVDSARKSFDDLKAKGYTVYKVNPDTGEKDDGRVMTSFEPEAGKMIAIPRMAGG